MKKIIKLLLILVCLLCASIALLYILYTQSLKAIQTHSEQTIFHIENGKSTKQIIEKLYEDGLIKNKTTAYYFAKFNHFTDMKAGTYKLDKNWSVSQILSVLSDSKQAIANSVSVTLIEGDWAKDVAYKIAQKTNVSKEELLQLWNDHTYLKSLQQKYPFLTDDILQNDIRIPLEGYLAPNTYQFFQDTTPQEITEKILDQSLVIFNLYQQEIMKSKFSIHEIYTLASIIQYEASDIENMKIIAGVFLNRLKQNMPLQSSVTVCYAIDLDNKEDWKACELAKNASVDSPYNTYKYFGLPIGPIMNPGAEAIEAVLNPTENENLYFAADVYHIIDGKVHYAKNYAEHLENVEKLKLNY